MYVLVNVEPEGVVAMRNVSERQFILFNIGSARFLFSSTLDYCFLLREKRGNIERFQFKKLREK